MSLGKRIKQARNRFAPKITQQMIADEFGITLQAVSGWERDEGRPDWDKMPALAKFLKVPLLWLSDGPGPPPPPDDIQVRLEALPPAERATLSAIVDTILKKHWRAA